MDVQVIFPNTAAKQGNFILYSAHLILSRISLALSGTLFWLVAVRFYSVEDIGLGSVFISVTSFLIFLATLGMVPALIRFIPETKDRGRLVGTYLSFSLFFLLLYLLFLAFLSFVLPGINFFGSPLHAFFFFIFAVSLLFFQVLEGVYLAFKKTSLVLGINLMQNFLRIGLLLFFIALGGFGIFCSHAGAAIFAIVVSYLYFRKNNAEHKPQWEFDMPTLKILLPFSAVNFLNAVPLVLPGMIFPLIIFSIYSAREAGFFYIPWMIFSVYCGLINSINSVFLLETSSGQESKKLLRKVIILSFVLAAGGISVFGFFGEKILLIFKKDFALGSLAILRILFFSIFFYSLNQIYITVLNIKKDVHKVGIISGLIALSLFVLTALFLPKMKTQAIAFAWLIANFLGSIYVLLNILKKRKLTIE